MPTYRIKSPDGVEFDVTAPDGASEAEVLAYAQANMPEKTEPKAPEKDTRQRTMDQLGGLLRGAGSIGSTLIELARTGPRGEPIGTFLDRYKSRTSDMDQALTTLGADTQSGGYRGFKLGAEVAGSLGAGQAVGGAVAGMGLPRLGTSIATAGMNSGGAGLGVRTAGGAISGLTTAGLVDPNEAKAGAVIGGVIPGVAKAVGSGAEAAGAALRHKVGPEVRDLAVKAKSLGIDIPADRLFQSKPLDAVASGLNYMPFSGRAATEARMSEQLNRALSRTFGQNSSNVTAALRKAEDQLGAKFDATLRSTGVAFDKQFLDDLADVYNTAERELGADSLKAIKSQVDDLVEKGSSGVIDGQAAYNIKRKLDRIGRGVDPNAWHALELKSKLMDALNRSLGDEGAKAFAKVREQYGNMLSLQKLAKNGVEGEISAARLANMQNINNKPLQDLADIAAQFVKPREAQHGAMQRALVGLTAGSLGGPVGLAGTATAGRLANAALNSRGLNARLLGEPATGLLANPETFEALARPAPLLLAP